MVGCVCFYPFMKIVQISMWQFTLMVGLGFSVYFNLLMVVRLVQSQRVSTVMGVMAGIIVISSTKFTGTTDYVACLTIVLSILVLLKMEYLDKEEEVAH
jgi:hypothetical protein